MDFDITEIKNKTETGTLAGATNIVERDASDHSPSKLIDLMEECEKLQRKSLGSTDDFEHLDHDPLLGSAFPEPVKNKDQNQMKNSNLDDFFNTPKEHFGNFKAGFGNNLTQFTAESFLPASEVTTVFESQLSEKISQTKDFMQAERQPFADIINPEPANNDSKAAENPIEQIKERPEKPTQVNKLIKEDNEKFISSEDLLGDFKEDWSKAPDIKQPVQLKVEQVKTVKEDSLTAKQAISDKQKEAPITEEIKPASKSKPQKKSPEPPQMISAEEMFCRFGLDAWFKPERLHPQVESLIYWRDVKKSGIVSAAGLIVLLAISCFSVISVFAYLSLLALTGTIVFRIYKTVLGAVQKTSEGHPFKEYLELDLTLSQDKVQQIVTVAVAHVNGFLAELRRLFLVEDFVDSLKFGVVLWSLTYIGAWFNGMTLVILAFVSLFTLPKVYENNKQSIDTYLDLVRSKFLEITEKVKAAVPIGKKPETDKDK